VTGPVRALAAAAGRAAEGIYDPDELDQRVPLSGHDEIGALAAAVRTMLADLRDRETLVALIGGASLHAPGPAAPTRPVSPLAGAIRDRAAGANGAALPQADAAAPETGSRFAGRYDIEAVVGQGGVGVVYRAVDIVLGELVAVKTLRPEALDGDPTALDRFKNELRLARRISHHNVVRLHDLGEAQGIPFITMEYVADRRSPPSSRHMARCPCRRCSPSPSSSAAR
jgi:eukaryotic-like serine/threonine-protein kinase